MFIIFLPCVATLWILCEQSTALITTQTQPVYMINQIVDWSLKIDQEKPEWKKRHRNFWALLHWWQENSGNKSAAIENNEEPKHDGRRVKTKYIDQWIENEKIVFPHVEGSHLNVNENKYKSQKTWYMRAWATGSPIVAWYFKQWSTEMHNTTPKNQRYSTRSIW